MKHITLTALIVVAGFFGMHAKASAQLVPFNGHVVVHVIQAPIQVVAVHAPASTTVIPVIPTVAPANPVVTPVLQAYVNPTVLPNPLSGTTPVIQMVPINSAAVAQIGLQHANTGTSPISQISSSIYSININPNAIANTGLTVNTNPNQGGSSGPSVPVTPPLTQSTFNGGGTISGSYYPSSYGTTVPASQAPVAQGTVHTGPYTITYTPTAHKSSTAASATPAPVDSGNMITTDNASNGSNLGASVYNTGFHVSLIVILLGVMVLLAVLVMAQRYQHNKRVQMQVPRPRYS